MAHYFRHEFEPRNIYRIRNKLPEDVKSSKKTDFKFGGQYLFKSSITFQDLETLLNKGNEIKRTYLTEEFSFEDYLNVHQDRRLPLFAIDENRSIYIFTHEHELKPKPGWSLLALAITAVTRNNPGLEK